jgi:hypothetical protein
MTTVDVRREWLSLVESHVRHRLEPAAGPYRCPEYDRMSRERLREVQEEQGAPRQGRVSRLSPRASPAGRRRQRAALTRSPGGGTFV